MFNVQPSIFKNWYLILLVLGMCFFLATGNAQQRFKAGINVGLTAAQINGDESAGFNKVGLTAGVRAYTILTPKSDILIEILFSQRGSRTKVINGTTVPQKIIQLNYIEVPIIYTIKDWYQDDDDYYKMHFQAGLSYGRLFENEFTNTALEVTAPFLREDIVV